MSVSRKWCPSSRIAWSWSSTSFTRLAGKLGKDEEGVFRVEYDDHLVDGVKVIEAAADCVSVEEGTETFSACNHAVLDGTSTGHFMSSWVQICSSVSVSAPPFRDRTMSRNTRVKLDLSLPADPKSNEPKLRERVFRFKACIETNETSVHIDRRQTSLH